MRSKAAQVSAALYMRLSKDDELAGESASIENQRTILRDYADSNGFYIFDEYADDGWSGTNFDRPAFKRMMSDVESGKVNCILVKDLSRFGREHVMFGYYLEFIFPSKGVRFIAVGNGFDTAKDDRNNSMLIPFMNLMNDMYARDASEKIKAVLHTKMRNGELITSHEPIGYRKDPENRHTFIVDEETAPIVRRIFFMALNGCGANSIARILTADHIPAPAYWAYVHLGHYAGKFSDGYSEIRKCLWYENTVYRILKDEIYIGNMVHLKHGCVSYKNQRRITYDESRWIRSEGTHPAIISKEDFWRVQELLKTRKRKCTGEYENVFSGIARCSQCGRTMRIQWRKKKNGLSGNLICSMAYKPIAVENHTSHYISYDALYDSVLQEIKLVCSSVRDHKNEFVEALEKNDSGSYSSAEVEEQEILQKANKRLDILKDLLAQLYEDKLSGVLTEKNFKILSERYQNEQEECENKILEIKERLSFQKDMSRERFKFIELVEQYLNPEKLTTELLHALVDAVYISEARTEDGVRKQDIEISWRFVGKLVL